MWKKKIMSCSIDFKEKSDKLIQGGSKNGLYSVKKGYNAIIELKQQKKLDIHLKLYWDQVYLPKEDIFLWVTLQKIIMREWFKNIGFEGS